MKRMIIMQFQLAFTFLVLVSFTRAAHTSKGMTFTFDDGAMMKLDIMEENSLTYELYKS